MESIMHTIFRMLENWVNLEPSKTRNSGVDANESDFYDYYRLFGNSARIMVFLSKSSTYSVAETTKCP